MCSNMLSEVKHDFFENIHEIAQESISIEFQYIHTNE